MMSDHKTFPNFSQNDQGRRLTMLISLSNALRFLADFLRRAIHSLLCHELAYQEVSICLPESTSTDLDQRSLVSRPTHSLSFVVNRCQSLFFVVHCAGNALYSIGENRSL